MPHDITITKDINKLISWSNKRGYSVIFCRKREDMVDNINNIITINTKFKKEFQLYALLHECGHVLIGSCEKRYKKMYPFSYRVHCLNQKTFSKRARKYKPYQIDIISEEIDAWRRGKSLAKKLKIHISEHNYNKEIAKWVFTYINSAHYYVNNR